jgi:hypothetical protein
MAKIKTTSRDLIRNLLNGTQVERVPLRETFWPETLSTWVDQGYPTHLVFKEVGEKCWRKFDGRWVATTTSGEYEEPIPPYQHFSFDTGEIDFLFDYEPIFGYRKTIAETDEWEEYRNGAGGVMRYWKHKSGTPEHIDFHMTSREIWEEEYRPNLLELDPRRIEFEEIGKRLAQIRQDGKFSTHNHPLVWELLRFCLGDLTMYPTLLTDPDWVLDMGRVYTDFYKAHYAHFFAEAGVFDGIFVCEDLAYNNNLFASPQTYQKLIFPFFEEIIAFYRSYGVKVFLHSDGAVRNVMPFVAEMGFDAFNPTEAKAKGNDIFQFAELYGDQLAFIGGLDARIFETNDKDVIQAAVSNFMERLKALGARFIFASDHSISPLVTYDSYRYALDAYHLHKKY